MSEQSASGSRLFPLSMILGLLQVILLLHAFSLPQYGDGAIGTLMVYLLAVALFAVQLVLVVVWVGMALARGRPVSYRHVLLPLLLGPALLGAFAVRDSLRRSPPGDVVELPM